MLPALIPVCLELPPDAGDIRRHPPAGFQITAKLAQAGVDSGYCRLCILTLPLSAVQLPPLVHQRVDLCLKRLSQHGELPIIINAVLPQKLALPLVLAQFFYIRPDGEGDGAAAFGPGPAQQVQIVHIEGPEPVELFSGYLPDIAPPYGVAPGD